MSLTKVTYSMISGACVNVLDYGADPTGATDSQPAIQAAIDAAYAASPVKAVYLPEGEYLVDDSIILYDYMEFFGAGMRLTKINGDLASKSIIKTQYGETPSYTDRTIGWNLHDFSIDANEATDSVGLNLGNVGYSSIANVYVINATTGLFCSQRTYYLFCYGLQLQNCYVCAHLQSDGGGNHFVNSNFGFTHVGVYIQQGGWDFTGGVIDTAETTAAACFDVGEDGGTGTASLNCFNMYVEAVDSSTSAVNFYETTVNSTLIGLQRRNSVGGVAYSLLCDKSQVTNISQTGQFNYESRNSRLSFTRDIVTGVVDAYIKSQGNQINIRNNDDSAYGYLGANSFCPGGDYLVRWTNGTGSPEGVVSASPGAMYLNLSGGAGTTLYVKEIGTGNTGWAAK